MNTINNIFVSIHLGEDVTIVSEGEVVMGTNASYIIDKKPWNQQSQVLNNVIPNYRKVNAILFT